MSRSLASLLQESAARFPDRIAVVDPSVGESIQYVELQARVGEIAAALRQLGVGPGDRVGICMPKSIGAVAAIFAVLECGAAYVPVDAGAPPASPRLALTNAAKVSSEGWCKIVMQGPREISSSGAWPV